MPELLKQLLIILGWLIVSIGFFAISLIIILKIYTFLTPEDEWKNIEKGNISMSLILGILIICSSIIIAIIIKPKTQAIILDTNTLESSYISQSNVK